MVSNPYRLQLQQGYRLHLLQKLIFIGSIIFYHLYQQVQTLRVRLNMENARKITLLVLEAIILISVVDMLLGDAAYPLVQVLKTVSVPCNLTRLKLKDHFSSCTWNITQQAHDVYTTSAQRRCNVMTLHRR